MTDADPDSLDRLLDRQHYRLAHWRTAERELDYRRFFDVTTLIGLRVEDPRCSPTPTASFSAGWRTVHSTACAIDHIDGLRLPASTSPGCAQSAPMAVDRGREDPRRPASSFRPGQSTGTTGYDALDLVDGVFVDPSGEAALTELFVECRW